MQPDWITDRSNNIVYMILSRMLSVGLSSIALGGAIAYLTTLTAGLAVGISVIISLLTAYAVAPYFSMQLRTAYGFGTRTVVVLTIALALGLPVYIALLLAVLVCVPIIRNVMRETQTRDIEMVENIGYSLTMFAVAAVSLTIITTLLFGLAKGLIGGLAFGIQGGIRGSERVGLRVKPNGGIFRSARSATLYGLFSGLVTGIYAYLLIGQIAGIVGSILIGIAGGVLTGIQFGGVGVLHHLALRAVLSQKDNVPTNLADFLEAMVSLRVLRRVGGGYMFVHRYLLEYFAQQK